MTSLVSPATPKWSDRFVFDMALLLEGSGETLTDLTKRYGLTTADIVRFKSDKPFLRKLETYRTEIREKGLTFRLKARSQSEELLLTSWALIHSPDTLPSVKADLIKATVKWAGLEPNDKNQQAESSSGVSITINLGGQELPTKIIDITPEEA